MDIRKRKIRGYFAVFVLLIITSICLAMAIPSVSTVAPSEVAYAAVTPGTASVLNLTEQGVAQDNFSKIITGKQNEYIYFGSNVTDFGNNIHTGAIKWRVLSSNDTKYSSGNMLLWADYQLGSAQYNAYYNNPNYAFYGNSIIRANLNGGKYYTGSSATANPTTTVEVKVENSWQQKLFGENERASIVAANSMESKCWGFISNTFATAGIVGTGSGQYNSTNIGNINTLGSYASVNGTSVIETIPAGDGLFLLDYYDINNMDYGFSDNGTVYANKVNPSWTPSSAWYPSYYDNNNNGSITSDYLNFSGDIVDYYWLRPAGRTSTAYSQALYVGTSGYVNVVHVNVTLGVRPAFNFDPSNIIYATAADVGENGRTFVQVSTVNGDKPAYKVYVKTADYVNYNEQSSDTPIVSASDKAVTVTKSGASGNAIILLADKSGSGNVVYQATSMFNGGVATATLPSGINASDYSVTVLFADNLNGDEYSENIKGSYTVQGPLSIPKDIPAVDYNGSIQTLDTLKTDLDWFNSVYVDSSAVQIKYFNSEGSELSADNLPKNAGKYKIQFTILKPNEYSWGDSTGDGDITRTISFEINQVTIPYPSITGATSKPYSGGNDVRFQLDGFDPNAIDLSWKDSYTGVSINSTSPPYSVSAQTVGTYELVATIKPDQAINYKFASTPKIEVTVEPAKIIIEKIVTSGGGNNSSFSISEGTASISADIYVDVNGAPLGSDIVPITIFIPYGSSDITVSQGITLDASTLPSTSYQLTNQQIINLGGLFEGNYTFDVKSEDKNYIVEFKDASAKPTLTVLPAGQRTNILWKLYEGSSELSSYRTVTELNETGVKNLSNTLTYTGKEFRFEVELPNGYTLDGGYNVEKISGSGSILGQDAGTYRTTIKLSNGQEYSIEWTIEKAKFDLSDVKWQYPDGNLPYTVGGISAVLNESNLPDGLIAHYTYSTIKGTAVGQPGNEEVYFELDNDYAINYVLPEQDNEESYDGDFEWTLEWRVVKAVIEVKWITQTMTDDNGAEYTARVLDMSGYPSNIITYRYYQVNSVSEITPDTPYITKIEVEENTVKTYIAQAVFTSDNGDKYELSGSEYSIAFGVGTFAEELQIKIKEELTYNGSAQNVDIIFEKGSASADVFEITYYDKNGTTPLAEAPTNVGEYRVEIKIKDGVSGYYLSGENVEDGIAIINYAIKQMQIDGSQWNTSHNPPSLKVTSKEVKGIRHEYEDMDGNPLSFGDLKAGNKYRVRAVITDKNNYVFADGSTETEWVEFEVSENEQLYDPDDPNNPYYPNEDGENPNDPTDVDKDAVDELLAKLKELPLWQLIASIISIILIIAFLSKMISNESKRKKAKKTIEKKYNTYYAAAFLGLSVTNWTVIACVLMGCALLSLIFMIISQKRRNSAEEELDEAKEESARKKEEDMKMMFMHMMGGNAGGMNGAMGQQGYVYSQQGVGVEEMRMMINEAVTALLPNVQQYLPQQASANDELVQELIEQNKKLMQKLSEQQPIERVVEREVARDGQVVEKIVQVDSKDDIINKLVEGQEKIMKLLSEQSNEKIVEKIVEVPVEKIVEKEVKVEVPVEVEKVVEKVVEVPVEKIVEKEIVKEVPIEVEKVVEKIVEIPAAKPVTKAKTVAPRLTLDEAYAKLSAKQKKIFDTLKEYAISKDKCKEKKSTYYILLGQSSVNPLVKLTIKKDTTVALFKMEDEFMKDIRRNATNDGTKVKVKETELIVGDMQALATAKEMVDLREDQIERYNDYLKEQRSMKNK